MIPLLENEDELKEFLEYCEQAVEKTGNTRNECGPSLQLCHFSHKLTHPALGYQSKPVVVLLSEVAWPDVCAWERWGAEGPRDCIAGMRCCYLSYPEIFDTFNGEQLTSTTLWSFSGSPNLADNPSQDIEIRNKSASFPSWDQQWKQLNVDISNIGGITKLTFTYD